MGCRAGGLSAWLCSLALASAPARAAEPVRRDKPRETREAPSPEDLELLRDLELLQDLELLRSWDPQEDLPIPAGERQPVERKRP
jgi:hypothetical protein